MNARPDIATNAAARVTLTIPAALRMHTGGAGEIVVNAASVRDALGAAGVRYPSLLQHVLTRGAPHERALRPYVKAFVRNNDVRDLQGLDTPLADGDEVMIVPSVAGG